METGLLLHAQFLPAQPNFASYEDWQKQLFEWLNTLKAPPGPEQVEVNKFADNAQFVPIGVIEEKLDYFYSGLWEHYKFTWQVIANEVVGSIVLKVFHPKQGVWLRRTGVAAVQIQLRAEYETDPETGKPILVGGKKVKKEVDVTDVSKKIVNTLGKDFPHLKAECLKNAAKSLGNTFGRNLNRGPADTTAIVLSVADAEHRIEAMETLEDLYAFHKVLPATMRSDRRIMRIFRTKEKQIKDAASAVQKPEGDQ